MLNRLALKIADCLFDESDAYPMEIYVYGIELLISSLISTFLIIAVGIITHSLWESIIYLALFSLIRFYTGGYHCMSYLGCNILSVLSYIFSFIFYFVFQREISSPMSAVAVLLLSVGLAAIFAPVKHENKELTQHQRNKYKLISVFMFIFSISLCYALFCIFGVKQGLIIFPTCLVIDAAMLAAAVKNYIILRRKQK